MLIPALLADDLDEIAAKVAAQPEPPSGGVALIETHLAVLSSRLMPSRGWVGAERFAQGETLVTGREHPYDESTVRKRANDLAHRGGAEIVERVVEESVEQTVLASEGKAVVYTDVYDQPYWTKKPAYAAPIASRGNRLLAATYFGATFVELSNGVILGYHISWHKPASPLRDALEALHDEPRRAAWLSENARLHIWDRGGSGVPVLRWALERGIPYLTVMNGSTRWTRFRGAPQVYTEEGVPVFVRRDGEVARGLPQGSSADQIIYPAHPEKGREGTESLCYRSGAELSDSDLRALDQVYKARWPCNENTIKSLVAIGFDRNLDRGLTLTSSRGKDGRSARLGAREAVLEEEIDAFHPTALRQGIRDARKLHQKQLSCAREREAIAAIPDDKGARMNDGAELLCKNLMVLICNRLAMLLSRSRLEEVRVMTPERVIDLLLARTAHARSEDRVTTLWVAPVSDKAEHALQEELVRLVNERALMMGERRLSLRLNEPTQQPRQA